MTSALHTPAKPAPGVRPLLQLAPNGREASAFEEHFDPKDLAKLWKLDASTIRRLFQDQPGVLKLGSNRRNGKRDYVTLRIREA